MFCLTLKVICNEITACRIVPYYQKRCAGFQPSQSGISMELKMRLIERKKKKVEKLSKQPLEYIPIVDFYIPYSWKESSRKRKLPELSEEISDRRILLEKKWKGFVQRKYKDMEYHAKQLMYEQNRALDELKKESLSLYEEAIKCIDLDETQISFRGPVQTMPIVNYAPPLGGFIEKEPPFSSDDIEIPQN